MILFLINNLILINTLSVIYDSETKETVKIYNDDQHENK